MTRMNQETEKMNCSEIEKKWKTYWEENETFKTDVYDFSKPKFYCLDMFPYPSGSGLHAGHPEGYTATDVVSRMKRMQGYNVLHPIGWDAFGLPAEQHAIETGNHPDGFTENNIKIMTTQLKKLGFSYDWSKEINTSDPKYYKWTQWIFKRLYEDGLAKLIDMPVNWCEELGTVLANDEVVDGKSERGGYPVIRKNMKQWVIDMPAYAEKLLLGLEDIDWPNSTKEIQKNWIGKSIGAQVKFKVANSDYNFKVFTTRPDTLFGATYCVLSPEHNLINKIVTPTQKEAVEKYKKEATKKSDLERTELNKDKTGVFTGAYAINPVDNKSVPIWISDYVLASYGTGAIMAVPAHDDRDYEFATKFNIPITQVIAPSYDNGYKEGAKNTKRTIVYVVIKDKEDNYLLLDWKKEGWKSFVCGGVEEGETIEEAALREAHEESGYKNIVIDSVNDFYFTDKFYASHKDVNREVKGHIAYAHLENDEKVELDEAEKKLHTPVWIKKQEALNFLNKPVKECIEWFYEGQKPWTGNGIHINSEFLDGLNKEEAINKMIEWLEENNVGSKKINYHVREWIFARQRYWGEPIPIVHLKDGSMKALSDSELPLVLPKLDDYKPSAIGASPLDRADDWVNVIIDGESVKRETSTMPGSAASSWYFLRYIDPQNENEIADKKLLEYWMPVDLYVGGPEHAVGHLLYSRMWNNYLYDKGIVPVKEPFKKLVHQGMILDVNGNKMGKRHPEFVVNPNDVVAQYGADTFRLYEMFMGPLEADKPWNYDAVDGARRFLDRVWRLYHSEKIQDQENKNLETIYHQTVKKVTNDYETLNINTAISQMMIFINAVNKEDIFPRTYAKGFIKLLNPVAPFITEELWNTVLNHQETISYATWPTYDESKLVETDVTISISINGKMRATITVKKDLEQEKLIELAKQQENIIKYIKGKEIKKVIVVPNKVVNIIL